MVIIYGSRLFGKVDVVPGLFHVETRFGHLYYFPLIPLGSYAVLNKSGDNFNGIKLPKMSLKSIFYAWLRAGCVVTAIFSLLMVVVMYGTAQAAAITFGIVAASSLACWALLTFHKGSTHASYDRAMLIGQTIGLTPEGFAFIEQHFQAKVEVPVDTFGKETERFNADL